MTWIRLNQQISSNECKDSNGAVFDKVRRKVNAGGIATGAGSPNAEAMRLIRPEIPSNTAIFLGREQLTNLQQLRELNRVERDSFCCSTITMPYGTMVAA